jgi:hypothetical protein
MPTITQFEYVEINSVPLATPAWEITDLAPLWDAAPIRGGDRLIPFQQGVDPVRGIVDAFRCQLPFIVYGDFDQDGTPIADARAGLWTNIRYLQDQFCIPNPATIEGTWPLILHAPDGSSWGGDCKVLPPLQLVGATPAAAEGVFDILIPAGGLVEIAS